MGDKLPKIDDALKRIADDTKIDDGSKRAASKAGIEANEIEAFCRGKREAFYRCVRSAFQEFCHGIGSGRKMPSEGQVTEKLDEYAGAIAKVRELVEFGSLSGLDAPATPLEGAAMHARGLVQGALNSVAGSRLPEVMVGGLSLCDDLAKAIGEARTNVKSNAVYRRKGRKPDAGGDLATELFIYQLLFYIREFGGKVRHSLTKPTHPGKASPYLGDIVDYLRPFLPTEFPKELSGAVYDRVGRRLSEPVANRVKIWR